MPSSPLPIIRPINLATPRCCAARALSRVSAAPDDAIALAPRLWFNPGCSARWVMVEPMTPAELEASQTATRWRRRQRGAPGPAGGGGG